MYKVNKYSNSLDILRKHYMLYPMRGLKSMKCAACNLCENDYSSGFRCFRSGLFFHSECTDSSIKIFNSYHPKHFLKIKVVPENVDDQGECKLCRGNLPKMYYYCSKCDFAIDLICAKKQVIEVIEVPIHEHPLSLVPKMIMFTCHLCGLPDDRFPYGCKLCDLRFHKDCAESTAELNYPCHPKHPLKRLTRVPDYMDGTCCLCKNRLHNVFYHCSICKFSIDVDCAKNPPSFTLVNPKAHEHQLIFMPHRSFVCNACGMSDDPNPYVCSQCNFMIHRNCLDIPRVIKINRHDHRINYNHCLDAGNWKCGVCHEEINWSCGAYTCSQCPDFVAHVRCATKFGIWQMIELEGISEDTLEVKSYETINEGIIKHFSHNHALKLKEENDASNEYMGCKACAYPIYLSPFYSCTECDDFILHKKCAYLPKKKIDFLYKMPMTLCSTIDTYLCTACQSLFQGFKYTSEYKSIELDIRCGSISESFVHESHPLHPLYINYSTRDMFCNACGDKATMSLSCEECGFFLDIKCSILPKMVKHKYDTDHFWSLCYGEEKRVQYICEVCEEELDSEKWFYSCDDCGITSHIRCTLGDFIWFKPESDDDFQVFLNNRLTRPLCNSCESYCQFPSFFKGSGYTICSLRCLKKDWKKIFNNLSDDSESDDRVSNDSESDDRGSDGSESDDSESDDSEWESD